MAVRALVGFDGSMAAAAAIEAGALLLPDVHGWITYLWVPPFTGDRVRRRLQERIGNVNDLIDAVEREGTFEAQRRPQNVTHTHVRHTGGRRTRGVATSMLAAADEHGAAVLVLGSRGRSAAREILLGSVAMSTLHHSHRPVMVVPSRP